MFQPTPEAGAFTQEIVADFDVATQVVVELRAIRQKKNISPKEPLKLKVKGQYPVSMNPVVAKMANIDSIEVMDDFSSLGSGETFMVNTLQFYVPLEGMIDVETEKAKILAEIARYEGFLKGVNAKLGNEKFVANAPAAVVEMERKKQSDATTKLENLRQSLEKLG